MRRGSGLPKEIGISLSNGMRRAPAFKREHGHRPRVFCASLADAFDNQDLSDMAYWRQPVKWNADARGFRKEHGHRPRVFCASLADVFDNKVPMSWREDLFELIRECRRLDCSGSDYLNRISASIGGVSAGVKLPSGRAAG
jgi:Protein of unknown function (DUF5131)